MSPVTGEAPEVEPSYHIRPTSACLMEVTPLHSFKSSWPESQVYLIHFRLDKANRNLFPDLQLLVATVIASGCNFGSRKVTIGFSSQVGLFVKDKDEIVVCGVFSFRGTCFCYGEGKLIGSCELDEGILNGKTLPKSFIFFFSAYFWG